MKSKYALPKKTEIFKLSEESARDQVIDLLDYYDIDIEKAPDTVGEDGGMSPREALERALDQLTAYVRRGRVEIERDADNRIKVRQTLSKGEPLEFREVNAHAKLAMDRAKGKGYGRLYAMMGSLCGLGETAITKLPARDLAVVEILGTVFSNA